MNSTAQRLQDLRNHMADLSIDAVIIPSSDPHYSEYVADHWKSREWISGFTGSAGIAVITGKSAGLVTDGRYYTQAATELKGTGFELLKISTGLLDRAIEFLNQQLRENHVVAMDFNMFSINEQKKLKSELGEGGIKLVDQDLVSPIWLDRPDLPGRAIFEHDLKYAGKSRIEKLSEVREEMVKKGVDGHITSALDEIGWALNLRGYDVECNPVFIAHLAVETENTLLFIDPGKVNGSLKSKLQDSGVEIHDYDEFESYLKQLGGRDVWIDPARFNARNYSLLNPKQCYLATNPMMVAKSIKNETEIKHLRHVMIKDGVALTHAFVWLEEQHQAGNHPTEYEFAMKIAECRSKQELYYGESFHAIVGYRGNGAIIHYRPQPDTSASIKPEGILLCDSGGQYQDGTTDITRTIALSEPICQS